MTTRIHALQEQFRKFIQEEALIEPGQHVLAAVSGGIDSVVMLDLLVKAGYPCAAAHCNFQLRGIESDEDESLVRSLAEKNGIRFHGRRFDTAGCSAEEGISIQMAARKQRYQWFDQLCEEFSYDRLATAHNRDDVIETFFINLSRGTGIRGLSGMKPKKGRLIRPLLFASRTAINGYAADQQIDYREDSSNASTLYTRNKIRHELIPLFEEINPDFSNGIMENINRLRQTERIFLDSVEKKKPELLSQQGNDVYIDLEHLRRLSGYGTYLYELLIPYRFNSATVAAIEKSLEGEPGKQFYSETHRLVKDRNHLIISPRTETELKKYYIEEQSSRIREPLELEFSAFSRAGRFSIPGEKTVACLDHSRLVFPLILRKWHPGDYFCPLGMQHYKKVSDFFVDEKVPVPEKEKAWLLLSGEHIVWVVGHRIDDRYKIRKETGRILMIRLI